VPIEQIAVMHGVRSDRSDRDQIRRHSLFYRSMAWCPAWRWARGAPRPPRTLGALPGPGATA
jgi:hypothetical protein